MNITTDRDAFAAAVASAAKIARRDDHVHIVLTYSTVTAWCDNLVTQVATSVPVDTASGVEDPVTLSFPAKRFHDTIDAVTGTTLALSWDGSNTMIHSGGATVALPTNRVDIDRLTVDGTTATLPAADLTAAVARVAAAASRDDARPALTAIRVEPASGHLRFVATDSYRLHVTESRIPDRVMGSAALVPVAAFDAAAKLTGDATVTLSPLLIEFADASTSVVSRLIDAEYPDWKRRVHRAPGTEPATVAEVATDVCRDAFARAARLCPHSPIVVTFTPDDTSVLLEARSYDGIEYAAKFAAVSVTGGESTVAVDPRFIRDALAAVHEPTTTIGTTDDAGAPIEVFGENRREFVAVIMPIRV